MTNWLINQIWYRNVYKIAWLLFPLSLLYRLTFTLRRLILKTFCQKHAKVPVLVVGNITVGGTGKTPLVIAIAKACISQGVRVGIVSRGYGAHSVEFPYQVQLDDRPFTVGDEPLMIARRTHCPVVIAPKRNQAISYLLNHHSCDLILSDDGLQHDRMGRSIEMVVLDEMRGIGNGFCLPAGPLRESVKRLKQVDFIVLNRPLANVNASSDNQARVSQEKWPGAHVMSLIPGDLIQITSGQVVSQAMLKQPVAAVAAIGHPQRFFKTLEHLNIEYQPYAFPDHYAFDRKDFNFLEKCVLMTEKDAVKCHAFAQEQMYYVPVTAKLDEQFWQAFWSHKVLKGLLLQ